MKSVGIASKVLWQEASIREEKSKIKVELGQVSESGAPARLKHILSRISGLEDDASPLGQLRRFIYVISALVHHERQGGLTTKQIERLAELGHAILQVHGIKPTTSKLSFLYGDLHLALSQIHRQNGSQWKAAWEQQLSLQLSKRNPPGGAGFQALSIGIRALRLGHGRFACAHFDLAIDDGALGEVQKRLAKLYKIKALRLSSALSESADLAKEFAASHLPTQAEQLELEWEALCRHAVTTTDLAPMLAVIRKGKSHGQASYHCEARLWVAASLRTSFLEDLPSVRTMVKNGILQPKKLGFVYRCVKQLEDCYDGSYPFPMRLRTLGDMLFGLDHLLSIELELLAWVGASRWLARNNSFTLAALALKEYHSGSLRLTNGKSTDALLIASDLDDRAWHKS